MTSASQNGRADSLPRTVLQIAPIATASAEGVVYALRRVPGVLLAEIDPATARATIAHDAGVSTDALIAAAFSAGAQATIVTGTQAPATSIETGPVAVDLRKRRVVAVVFAVALLVPLFGSMNPNMTKNHILVPILLVIVWAFLIVRSSFGRRA